MLIILKGPSLLSISGASKLVLSSDTLALIAPPLAWDRY